MIIAVESLHIDEASTAALEATVETGSVEGRIFDKNRGFPIPHANVILPGMKQGSTTNKDGYFFIDNVPEGRHKIKAVMMGYKASQQVEISVKKQVTTNINLEIEELWSEDAIDVTGGQQTRCEVHDVEMNRVLVPVGYGLRVIDSKYEEAKQWFPNAEPYHHSGCVIRPPFKAWSLRCPKCVYTRNKWKSRNSWPDTVMTRRDWETYNLLDVFEFRAPGGAETTMRETGYLVEQTWSTIDLEVEACFGPWAIMLMSPYIENEDCVNEIVGIAYPTVFVIKDGASNGDLQVVARFGATPFGTNRMTVVVRVPNRSRLKDAAAIIKSIRFTN